MAARRMRIQTPCPACHEPNLSYASLQLDIPYFGEVTQLAFECDRCGFRHTDFLTATARKPTRHTLRVHDEDQMMVRVVRSASATIRIPELGVLIEPGPASDAYVTNVEGVLARVEQVLNQLHRDAEDPETRRECERRMDELARARKGQFQFTLIMEDPYGNSVVADPDVKTESIPPEEAEKLDTGQVILDPRDVDRPSAGSARGNGHR